MPATMIQYDRAMHTKVNATVAAARALPAGTRSSCINRLASAAAITTIHGEGAENSKPAETQSAVMSGSAMDSARTAHGQGELGRVRRAFKRQTL